MKYFSLKKFFRESYVTRGTSKRVQSFELAYVLNGETGRLRSGNFRQVEDLEFFGNVFLCLVRGKAAASFF